MEIDLQDINGFRAFFRKYYADPADDVTLAEAMELCRLAEEALNASKDGAAGELFD